jgi:hypothetical protein
LWSELFLKTCSNLISPTSDFHLIKLLKESMFMTSFDLNKWYISFHKLLEFNILLIKVFLSPDSVFLAMALLLIIEIKLKYLSS